MVSEHQIRERLASFLAGEILLDEFEDWFAQRTWNMHLSSDESSQKLAYAIELRLAEHSNEHLTDQGLEKELAPLVEDYTVTVFLGDEKLTLWSGALTRSETHFLPTPCEVL